MNHTTLTNIDIPFWRLTGIILKFMLASIPAVLLLYLIVAIFGILSMMLFGGILAGTGFLEQLTKDAGVEGFLEPAAGSAR